MLTNAGRLLSSGSAWNGANLGPGVVRMVLSDPPIIACLAAVATICPQKLYKKHTKEREGSPLLWVQDDLSALEQ